MSNPIVSRGPKGLAAAILAGGASMGLLLTALLHVNGRLGFLAYFPGVPLYAAGLGAGAFAGFLATVIGAAILYVTQPPYFAVTYLVFYGVPAVTLIRLALQNKTVGGKAVWFPEGRLMSVLTLYPCCLFLATVAATWSHPGGLEDLTLTAFNQFATVFAARFPDDQAEMFRMAMTGIAKIAPAFVAYLWITITMLSGIGAQYILQKNNLNLREPFRLANLYIPSPMIYGVAITGLAAAFAPAPYAYIGSNLALILGLPFFFVGLAVLHAAFKGVKYAGVILFAFYALMTLEPMVALIFTALGVIDQWVDFRRRINARKTTTI